MSEIILGYFFILLYINRFTDNIIIKIIPICFLIFLSYKYYVKNVFLRKRVLYQSDGNKNLLLLLLISILCIGIIRTNNPDATFTSTAFTLLSFIIFLYYTFQVYKYIKIKYDNNIKLYHDVIVIPFLLFALINIVFWIMGYEADSSGDYSIGSSILLASIGLNVDRVKFPFTNGINSYSSVIGLLFSVELVYVFIIKRKNFKTLFTLFIFFITLLLTDSRFALLSSLLVFCLLYFLKRRKTISFARFFPYLFVLGPFLVFALLPLLASTGNFSLISRSDEDIMTGNARFIIWIYSLDEFLSFQTNHLIGYGLFGHFASGTSKFWSGYFGYMANAETVHPHNTVLSILFDYGYLGAIIFLLFTVMQIKKVSELWNRNREFVIFYLSFFIYFVFISITESFFGFYYLNSIYIIFLFFLLPSNFSNK